MTGDIRVDLSYALDHIEGCWAGEGIRNSGDVVGLDLDNPNIILTSTPKLLWRMPIPQEPAERAAASRKSLIVFVKSAGMFFLCRNAGRDVYGERFILLREARDVTKKLTGGGS